MERKKKDARKKEEKRSEVGQRRKKGKKKQAKKTCFPHLSSTCGGRLWALSARSRPAGAGRPSRGRKAETAGAAASDEEEGRTAEAEGARGRRSGGSGIDRGAFDDLTTETRPALAARRRKAAPERACSLLFSFAEAEGGGGGGGGGGIFWGEKKVCEERERDFLIEMKTSFHFF